MKDISRRNVLKGVTAAGVGGLGLLGSGPVAANPHDEIVDELTGSDGGGGGSEDGCQRVVSQQGDGEYTTIQAALDDAVPGDVVCVHPGIYEEQITMTTDNVGLAAMGSANDTVIRSGGTTIDVTATGCFLFKFAVQNTETDGTAIAAGPSMGMRRCEVTVTDGTGVETTSSFSAVDNTFQDTGVDSFAGVGISSESVVGVRSDDGDGTFVSRNSFDEFRHGVHLTDCEEVALRGNVFRRNRYDGVRLRSTAGGPDVQRCLIDRNEFRDNGLGMILFEQEGARIEDIYAIENVFDNYSFGIYTSTRKIPYDVDRDGDTEPTPAPGPLRGGIVYAPCNYWGVPTGPNVSSNVFANRNWFTRQALPNGDRVTEGVDYDPWQTQELDTTEETTCVGGSVQIQL